MIWNGIELPEKNIYFKDDDTVIYCADCREILPLIPDKSIDLVMTSPPYDELREYGGYTWGFEDTAQYLCDNVVNGGVIVWVVGDSTIDGSETGTSFKQALHFKKIGLKLHDTMIWQKNSPPLTHDRYEQEFEYMFILSKGKPNVFNPIKGNKLWKDNRKQKSVRREKDGSYDIGFSKQTIDKIIGNIWFIPVGGGHCTDFKEAHLHPAIFPEALAFNHISSWSNPSNTVMDPFLGSGTTAVCAKKLGRKCIGIEIEEKYCKIAVDRLRQSVMNLSL